LPVFLVLLVVEAHMRALTRTTVEQLNNQNAGASNTAAAWKQNTVDTEN
jgi:tRNA U55 pseudouridine synthase TruB